MAAVEGEPSDLRVMSLMKGLFGNRASLASYRSGNILGTYAEIVMIIMTIMISTFLVAN